MEILLEIKNEDKKKKIKDINFYIKTLYYNQKKGRIK